MEELTIEESLEKYPYLRKMTESIILTTSDDMKNMDNGEHILFNGEDVLVEFLKRIIQNNNYYNYAKKFLEDKIPTFGVSYIIGGDTGRTIKYSKSTIVEGIQELINSKNLVLNPEEEIRYENLRNTISYEKLLDKTKDSCFIIEMDGISYSIPIKKMIDIMDLPDENFDEICNNSEIKTINGIPKEYFIYASYKFFRDNKIFQNFVIPENIKTRFKDIKSLQKIDLQAINRHKKTTDQTFKKVEINEDLRSAIISSMPQDISQLEKAIYIYIKMCKLLTYDDEYFAVNQKGPATEKHKDVNYVSNINLTNNKVVCFEFNLIYSKLLDELGINFKADYQSFIDEAYGSGHANLEFRSDKFLVTADSVTSILLGDIMRAKLNQPLVGLKCINKNKKTQQEFKNAVDKIYKLIAEQELNSSDAPINHIETFEELICEYQQTTSNIKPISLDEKLSILIEKVNSKKIVGVDSLSYVLQLKKILFDEEEKKNNISISIIRKNEYSDNRIATAVAIIALNKIGFDADKSQTEYYYYNPNSGLLSISQEELQKCFYEKEFEYIETSDPRIPGIQDSEVLKKR